MIMIKLPSWATWEMIVEPERPIPISQLEVIITEGEQFNLGLHRSALYAEITDYWNQKMVRMAQEYADELELVLAINDEKTVQRIMMQIGGISPKYGLSQAVLEGGKLTLALSITNYMKFISTSEHAVNDDEFRERLMQAGEEDYGNPNCYFANALALCGVIHGKNDQDNLSSTYAPLALRSSKMMIYPDAYHVFGGMVDIDLEKNKVDLDKFFRKELREEMGLEKEQISEPYFHGIVRQGPSRIPEVICSVEVNLTKEELEKSWKEKSPYKFEHRHLEFYNLQGLQLFFEQYGPQMVPSGAAALCSFLQHYLP